MRLGRGTCPIQSNSKRFTTDRWTDAPIEKHNNVLTIEKRPHELRYKIQNENDKNSFSRKMQMEEFISDIDTPTCEFNHGRIKDRIANE